MPTIAGLRRRGYTPEAIRAFLRTTIGVAKRENVDRRRPARVLRPRGPQQARAARDGRAAAAQGRASRTIPRARSKSMDVVNNPEDAVGRHAQGAVLARALHRARRLPRGPAEEVLPPRARDARCGCATPTSSRAARSSRTPSGEIVELRCTYDPATRGGDAPDGRKVKGTLHWVSAAHAVDAEVRLYDRLFTVEMPGAGDDGLPDAAQPGTRSKSSPGASSSRRSPPRPPARASSSSGSGYFCVDPDHRRPAGVQPHGHAQGRVGAHPGTRVAGENRGHNGAFSL